MRRTSSVALQAILALAVCLAFPAGAPLKAASPKGITDAQRTAYVAKAQVWDREQYEAARSLTPDAIKNGPTGEDAFTFNQAVTCRFVDPTLKNVIGGQTAKFYCGRGTDAAPCPECNVTQKELKVKFGQSPGANPEIYSEVIGTRLMWLLGFKADRDYSVRVTCVNCPADPWSVYETFRGRVGGLDEHKPEDVAKAAAIAAGLGGARATRSFPSAVIEVKLPGDKLKVDDPTCESPANEATDPRCGGFSWKEIPTINPASGGATREQLEAWELLAAFMTHGDNKPGNQRLTCPEGSLGADGICTMTYVMIQDIGAGFGSAGFLGLGYRKADIGSWSGQSLWADRNACRAKLTSVHELKNPTVSEAGRAFLAKLMDPTVLTDDKVTAIFEASRVTEKGDKFQGHPATVADWVGAFDRKRAELAQPCGGH